MNSIIYSEGTFGNGNSTAYAVKSMLDKGHRVIIGIGIFDGQKYAPHAMIVSSIKYTESLGWDIVIQDPAVGREMHINGFG